MNAWKFPRGAAMATVAIAAFFFLVALPRPAIPLIDGDVWWHIRAGEEILRTGRIPTSDTWSIVGAGMDWTSQDWLSNILLALGHRLGDPGLTMLSLLYSLLVVAALVLLWWGIGRRDPHIGWLARIAWLAVGVTVAGPVVGVRAQVIDLPLAAASLVILWHYVARLRRRTLIWLPFIAIGWANVHAGWPLLFLFGGAILVGEGLDRLTRRRLESPPLTWGQSGWLVGALTTAFLAISLNPSGPSLYLYPVETSAIQAHRDFLAEWSPPDLGSLTGQLFAGFVVLGVVPAFLLGWRRMRLADALILGGVTLMAATGARFLLVAGPIGGAVIAIALAPAISQSHAGRAFGPTLRRMGEPAQTRRLAAINIVLAATIAIAGLVVTMTRVLPTSQREAIAMHMPVAAVDWILANNPGTRPLNTYSWGGYLGLRRPDALVYIDGRSDIYGDAPIRRYADAISLRTDPQRLLDEHAIDHVLFNTHHPFADWLNASAGWRLAYTDDQASVWVRTERTGE